MILEHIQKRWSPRAFSGRPVEEEKINAMLEAAQHAPSSMNEQPWRFIYATKGTEAYDNIAHSLHEGNHPWASKAPLLIAVIAKREFSHRSVANSHARYDTGLAVGNLLVQATSMGLYAHQMGGFSADKLRESFAIGDGFDPVVIMAIGYLGDPKELPEKHRETEGKRRGRKPVSEIAFREHWINK